MPNIVLTRIDNRLVHGQVATQWCGAIGANLILVANDEVAGNSLRQGLMDMAAPSYAAMRYWTIQKTIDTIHKEVTVSSGPSERRNSAREPSPIARAERGAPQVNRKVRAFSPGNSSIASFIPSNLPTITHHSPPIPRTQPPSHEIFASK